MHKSKSWTNQKLLEKTADALRNNGFEAYLAQDGDDAVQRLLELIPYGATVGCGGSVTLNEIGIKYKLEKRGNRFLDPFPPGVEKDDSLRLRREIFDADVFLTSANAITETGVIVNMDGTGNRVAATIFGPKRVIFVAGVNKVTRNLEEALHRTYNVAATALCHRLGFDTPCATHGQCYDCRTADRACCVTVITERPPKRTPTTVLLVNEDLGF